MIKYVNRSTLICGLEVQMNEWSENVPIKVGKDIVDEYREDYEREEKLRKLYLGIDLDVEVFQDEPIIDTIDDLFLKVESVWKKEDDRLEAKEQNARRRRNKVINLINTNWTRYSKMLTLTFQNNITDIDIAHKSYREFIEKLTKYLGRKRGDPPKYLAVMERQKRGAIHYHICLFHDPFIPRKHLIEMWVSCGGGYQLDIRAKQDMKTLKGEQIENVGVYVAKYLSKELSENEDEKNIENRKRYFTSKGLKKPIKLSYNIGSNKAYDEVLKKYAVMVWQSEKYENEDSFLQTYQVFKYRFKSRKDRINYLKEIRWGKGLKVPKAHLI